MALLATVAAVLAATAPRAPEVVRGPVATQVTRARRDRGLAAGPRRPTQALLVGRRTYRVGAPRDAVVRLTGLVPGRRYPYAVQAGERIVARGSLRTAPPPAGRFRAAVFADHGTGGRRPAGRGAAGGRLAPGRPGHAGRPGLPADPRPAAGAELLPPAAPAPAPRRPRARAGQPRAAALRRPHVPRRPRAARGRALVPGALRVGRAARARLQHLARRPAPPRAASSRGPPRPPSTRASASRCCTTRRTRRRATRSPRACAATCCRCCGATASSCCCSGTCTPTSARCRSTA